MKLAEIENLFKKIKDFINYVETAKLEDRRITLYLSNGEMLNYCIPNSCIAHMLGINTNYLRATGLFKSENSYEILKEMCENPYRIYRNISDGHLTENSFLSKHIEEKINSFRENIKININDTEFICIYDKSKSYYSSEKNENCDYILVKKYNEDRIGVIYLVRNGFAVVPMSNQIYENIETAKINLEKLLINQEITMLNGNNSFNINTDYKQSYFLTLNQKAEKINKLKEYKNIFKCSIDIIDEYEYCLDKLTSNRTSYYENNIATEKIVNAIVSGSLIDRNSYKNSPLISIIDAYNNNICSKESNNEATRTYTEIIKELEEFKNKVLLLEKENETLNNKNSELTKENSLLKEENEKHTNDKQKILSILKPEN